MKTSITSPFDHIDREDLVRVQGGIPETLYHKLFKLQFSNSGAQDRIVSSLISMFDQLCQHYSVPPQHTMSNELKAQQILTDLQQHINNLILQKHGK